MLESQQIYPTCLAPAGHKQEGSWGREDAWHRKTSQVKGSLLPPTGKMGDRRKVRQPLGLLRSSLLEIRKGRLTGFMDRDPPPIILLRSNFLKLFLEFSEPVVVAKARRQLC